MAEFVFSPFWKKKKKEIKKMIYFTVFYSSYINIQFKSCTKAAVLEITITTTQQRLGTIEIMK